MRKKIRNQSKAKANKASSVKADPNPPCPICNGVKAKAVLRPTPADIAKILALKPDDLPDRNEPIILSDTWYEYSVFLAKFNICKNTAGMWLRNGWLPYSQIKKMRFINKKDIDDMMNQFRRSALLWITWLIPFSGEWQGIGL
jgi:hypothetical protein